MFEWITTPGSQNGAPSQKPKGDPWHTYGRLLRYAWRYKLRLLVSFLFAFVVGASFGSMILSSAAVVNVLFADRTVFDEQVTGLAEKTRDYSEKIDRAIGWAPSSLDAWVTNLAEDMYADKLYALVLLSVALVGLTVLAGVARYLQEYFAGAIGAHISVRLGDEMFRNVMRQPLRFFEQHSSGDLFGRMTNDVLMVNRGLSGVLVKLLREPFKAVVLLSFALAIDWFLTLAGLVVLVPVGYVIVRIGKTMKKSARRSLERIASIQTLAKETLFGMPIIKSFCMEDYEIRRMQEELKKLDRYLVRMVRADALVGPITELLLVLGLVAFLLLGASRVLGGRMSAFEFTALYASLAFLLDPIRKLTSVNNQIQASLASAERVFEFIDAEPDIVEAPDAVDIPPLSEAIRFEDVTFSYDGQNEVLSGIDLEVRKGEMVALVGFSGAGKSTLVRLLPRFYDPDRGRITFDGVDIRRATFSSLRGQISMVTQDSILFNETVRDNIAFGRADFDDERVRAAAEAAQAADFIEALPRGYDTFVGEAGLSLSGGQRQRLAIARAIIKDPAILILDEATSSLDSESEQLIQRAMDEFVVGRTSLVIAHRLSTIQRADRIVVLDAGRIVEQGTHHELLEKGGIYRRLYEIQFAPAPEKAPR